MSEFITIDTAEAVVKKSVETFEPLPLYDDSLPLLKKVMPEYTGTFPNPELTLLAKRLAVTRRKFGGIGLSANQCNIEARMFVIGTDDFEMVCINPEVTWQSPDEANDKEGCLSFPGMALRVKRPFTIAVKYQDLDGNVVEQTLDGITARCYLHELDHMNGVVFTDRVGKTAMMMAKKKKEKLDKKFGRMITRNMMRA
jgi:peptide deformylase